MSENHRVLEIWRESKDDKWEIVDSTGFSLEKPLDEDFDSEEKSDDATI